MCLPVDQLGCRGSNQKNQPIPMKFILFYFLFSFLTISAVKGQRLKEYTEYLPLIKQGTVYVTMSNPDSPKSKEYIDVFKKYWKLSKIAFIRTADIPKYASRKDFFLSINWETQNKNLQGSNNSPNMTSYAITHVYFELWRYSEKYYKKTPEKEFLYSFRVPISRINLFVDFNTLNNPETLDTKEYDGEGAISNWGTGIVKNHIQQISKEIQQHAPIDPEEDRVNSEELHKLQQETLYVPSTILKRINPSRGTAEMDHIADELFEDYQYNIELISTKSLNEKINTSKKPIYYLLYTKNCADKYITITNSQTGELIYYNFVRASYNIKSGDIKALNKQISN